MILRTYRGVVILENLEDPNPEFMDDTGNGYKFFSRSCSFLSVMRMKRSGQNGDRARS
jgi:hypothetical protein